LHDLAESRGEVVRKFSAHELQAIRDAIALVRQITVRISTS
jgi:hypothetical protein